MPRDTPPGPLAAISKCARFPILQPIQRVLQCFQVLARKQSFAHQISLSVKLPQLFCRCTNIYFVMVVRSVGIGTENLIRHCAILFKSMIHIISLCQNQKPIAISRCFINAPAIDLAHFCCFDIAIARIVPDTPKLW